MAMELKKWRSCSGTRSIQLGRGYGQFQAVDRSAATRGSWSRMWKLLWRKLLKERRKMMIEYSNYSGHLKGVPDYDEYTYSQNFDEGLMWEEPDSLSRSFSVRFAHPSRIFLKKGNM